VALVLPSEAEIKTQGQKLALLANEQRKWNGTTATNNFVSLADVLTQNLEGPWTPDVVALVNAAGSQNDAAFKALVNAFEPIIRTYVTVNGDSRATARDPKVVFRALYEYYAANSRRVKSRAFSFGSPSAGGSNVGTGVINRLTKDENNYDLEAQTPDAKTITCVSDYRSGTMQGEERFIIRGAPALPGGSWLQIEGSGRSTELRALSGSDSEANGVLNPSFSIYSGTTFTNWTTSGTVGAETSVTYRPLRGESSPVAIKLTGNGHFLQSLDERRINANPGVPMYVQVAYNRAAGSGDGTITLTFGNQTEAVVLAAQTGWNILRLPLTSEVWFKNWNKNSAEIKVAIASNTTGYTLFDDVIVAPMQEFDGAWYAPVGGATAFVRDDIWTFTDTCTDSILQRLFWLAFGMHLPHVSDASETWADP
jgi:hypothetical protein